MGESPRYRRGGPCESLVQRSLRVADTDAEQQQKRILVPAYAAVGGICAALFAMHMNHGINGVIELGCLTAAAALLVGGLLPSLLSHAPPRRVAEVVLSGCSVSVALIDLHTASAIQPRLWSLMILVMDGSLVAGVRPRFQSVFIVGTLLWLAIERSEAVTGALGLYRAAFFGDAAPTRSLSGTTVCDCAAPPCAYATPAVASVDWLGFAVVFIGDFFLTRGFSDAVRQQVEVVEASISIAEQISVRLAGHETEEAQSLLDGDAAAALPKRLRGALRNLVIDLRAWHAAETARRRALEHERAQRDRARVADAAERAGRLGHPMVLMKAADFAACPRLTAYEDLRDAGKLVVLDTEKRLAAFKKVNTIVFLSHQWLGWGVPDPDGVHHSAMKRAIEQVAARHPPKPGGDGAGAGRLYVWVDYCSIAQRHRGMQDAAVSSLPLYASQADAFVVVAPRTVHGGTGRVCDVGTYNLRGWCRAEMLSKVCGSGLRSFYVLDSSDGEIAPVTARQLDQLSLTVFDGEFSCCALGHKGMAVCDKETLMPAVLGLYSLAIKPAPAVDASGTDGGTPTEGPLWSPRSFARCSFDPAVLRMKRSKALYFPEMFTFVSCEGWEEDRELFGALIEGMENHIERPSSINPSRRRSLPQKNSPYFSRRGFPSTSFNTGLSLNTNLNTNLSLNVSPKLSPRRPSTSKRDMAASDSNTPNDTFSSNPNFKCLSLSSGNNRRDVAVTPGNDKEHVPIKRASRTDSFTGYGNRETSRWITE